MTHRLLLCCVFLLSAVPARADEQVRRVQEELRKRNLYFGDVDGRKTAEMRGAIRRYQERKGFAPTGELSADTLRSLDLVPDGKVAEQWPEGTVMKSDAARQIAESDRKLLEEISATEILPPGEALPIEPVVGKAEPPAGATDPATKSPAPVALGPDPTGDLPGDLAEEAKAFVQSYLTACATNRLEAEMEFYADRIHYFDHGTVDRAFVARDVQRFYKRWPERHYELLDFKLTKARKAERDVTFRIAFRYKNSEQSVAGRSLNFFKVRQDAEGLRFVSLKEQRVRD